MTTSGPQSGRATAGHRPANAPPNNHTSASESPVSWADARAAGYAAGLAVGPLPPVRLPLAAADGEVLAEPIVAATDLPPFDTASVDGYAVAGTGPWRLVGRTLAGDPPPGRDPADRNSTSRDSAGRDSRWRDTEGRAWADHAQAPDRLAPGTAREVATGAMVPAGTEWILRTENTSRHNTSRDNTNSDNTNGDHANGDHANGDGDWITGDLPGRTEWRPAGEEAAAGQQLAPAGTPITPAMIGLAAAAGADELVVRRRPRVALLVFGDELLSAGPSADGLIRDALGPSLPAWIRRLGADVIDVSVNSAVRPTVDSLPAQLGALAEYARTDVDNADSPAVGPVDVVVTTGGTMHGPVDHLRDALAALDAEYLVDTVAVRPGHPMLLARPPGGPLIAGLPGNPQAAVVALVTLVEPVLAALRGLPAPRPSRVAAAEPIAGRGPNTRLVPVRVDRDGRAWPCTKVGPAMLRGVAFANGYVVVGPNSDAAAGDRLAYVPLPGFTLGSSDSGSSDSGSSDSGEG